MVNISYFDYPNIQRQYIFNANCTYKQKVIRYYVTADRTKVLQVNNTVYMRQMVVNHTYTVENDWKVAAQNLYDYNYEKQLVIGDYRPSLVTTSMQAYERCNYGNQLELMVIFSYDNQTAIVDSSGYYTCYTKSVYVKDSQTGRIFFIGYFSTPSTGCYHFSTTLVFAKEVCSTITN